ncbi:MAG: tetratricopeptide repeat protein, partial [Desulfobacteraceae bacterium]
KSDIYALGVILYEMVTGSVPFKGDTALSVALKHKTSLPQDPKKLNPEISEGLSRLILICMEKERERRYQTAEALLDDLRNLEEGLPLGTKIRPKRETFASALIRKKLFIPAVVVVLAILVVAVRQIILQKEIVPLEQAKPSLAVLHFENNTGDESLDYWRKMLSDLLITDLSQSKYFTILTGDRLFEILSQLNQLEAKTYTSDILRAVSDRGRVSHLVLGTYARIGDVFRIDVTIQDPKAGEIIGSKRVEAKGEEEVFPQVDELTRGIKEIFNFSANKIAGDIDMEVGKITTSSPEAYKFYIEGKQYINNGNYRKGIELMEKALVIDPEFAMAYRSMAWGYKGIHYRSKWREFLQKALELTDRVSERERLLIEGDFYLQSENAYDEAHEAYLKLLEIYPDDKEGNSNLGWMYHQLQLYDKAIERLNILIQDKYERSDPYAVAAACYMAKGLYDKAKEILENYLSTISDNAVIHRNLSFLYLCQAKYDLALTEVEKAISIEPSFRPYDLIGNIYRLMGDLDKAENAYLKFLEADEEIAHYRGRSWLATFYLLQGKFRKSIEQDKAGYEAGKKAGERGGESGWHLDLAYRNLRLGNLEEALKESIKAEKMAFETGCMYCHLKRALVYKGVSYTRMKSTEKALEVGEELKKVIQEGMNPSSERYYHYLMGSIEFEKNNYSLALESFKKGVSLLSFQGDWNDEHSFFMEPLALSLYMTGQIEEAREIYERILTLTTGRLVWDDIYARSFYMLGKIYEEKGWEGMAIEHYEKFLSLWKDADPGIAEVEDAKKRVG